MLRSESFLIELMLLFLCFALCGGAALSLFVKADKISRENAGREKAVLLLQNQAEEFKASASAKSPAYSTDSLTYYDNNWLKTEKATAESYRLERKLIKEDGLATLLLILTGPEGELYRLEVKQFFPGDVN